MDKKWAVISLIFCVLVVVFWSAAPPLLRQADLSRVNFGVCEPNFAIVPLPSSGNPMFVVAAKEGKPNGIEEARKYLLDGLREDGVFFPLIAVENGELGKRIASACEKLAKKGYDIKGARFAFYFEE